MNRIEPTGLQYFNARYYDAEIGRFVSADTEVPNPKQSQSYNRYMFVCGNPVSFIDVDGHKSAWGGFCKFVKSVVENKTVRCVAYATATVGIIALGVATGGVGVAVWAGIGAAVGFGIGGTSGKIISDPSGWAKGGYKWNWEHAFLGAMIGAAVGYSTGMIGKYYPGQKLGDFPFKKVEIPGINNGPSFDIPFPEEVSLNKLVPGLKPVSNLAAKAYLTTNSILPAAGVIQLLRTGEIGKTQKQEKKNPKGDAGIPEDSTEDPPSPDSGSGGGDESPTWVDSDGDGVADDYDLYPNDPEKTGA